MVLQLILLSCHFHFVREKLTNAAMTSLQANEKQRNFRPRYGRRMQIPVLLMNRIIIVCLKYGAVTRIFNVKLFYHTHI